MAVGYTLVTAATTIGDEGADTTSKTTASFTITNGRRFAVIAHAVNNFNNELPVAVISDSLSSSYTAIAQLDRDTASPGAYEYDARIWGGTGNGSARTVTITCTGAHIRCWRIYVIEFTNAKAPSFWTNVGRAHNLANTGAQNVALAGGASASTSLVLGLWAAAVNSGVVNLAPGTSPVTFTELRDDPRSGWCATQLQVYQGAVAGSYWATTAGDYFGLPGALVVEIPEEVAAQTVTTSSIASAETFGGGVLSSVASIAPASMASAEAFGSALPKGSNTISMSGISSAEAFGSAAAASLSVIAPASIVSLEAFGTVSAGGLSGVSPNTIASAEAFGSAVLSSVRTVSPASISPTVAFGSASLGLQVTASSIGSAEAFGSAALGITTTEVIPSPLIVDAIEPLPPVEYYRSVLITVNAPVGIEAIGIPSQEAFGTPTVAYTVDAFLPPSLVIDAIEPPERIEYYRAIIVTNSDAMTYIAPGSIPSGEVFGSGTGAIDTVARDAAVDVELPEHEPDYPVPDSHVGAGAQFEYVEGLITPLAIPSEEAFGFSSILLPSAAEAIFATYSDPIEEPARVEYYSPRLAIVQFKGEVYAPSIPSEERFGYPTIAPTQSNQSGAFSMELADVEPVEPTMESEIGHAMAAWRTGEPNQIYVLSIPSQEGFGVPSFLPGGSTISPPSILSREVFGHPALGEFGRIRPVSIDSTNVFGAHKVARDPTIDGQTSVSIGAFESVTVYADGAGNLYTI